MQTDRSMKKSLFRSNRVRCVIHKPRSGQRNGEPVIPDAGHSNFVVILTPSVDSGMERIWLVNLACYRRLYWTFTYTKIGVTKNGSSQNAMVMAISSDWLCDECSPCQTKQAD